MAAADDIAKAAVGKHVTAVHGPKSASVLTKVEKSKLEEQQQLQDYVQYKVLNIIHDVPDGSSLIDVCDGNEFLKSVADCLPATMTRACMWCRLELWKASDDKHLLLQALCSTGDEDLAFQDFFKTEEELQKAFELCSTPFFVSGASEYAHNPSLFVSLLIGLVQSDEDVQKLMDCSEARELIRMSFLGWHCAHEDSDGLAHTAVALAPRNQRQTGKRIQEHIESVGGLKLIANGPAAVTKLCERLQNPMPDSPVEDHPYRLLLTLLFNNGRGTVVRGENPVVLVNPVVVHVHGTYLSSMATECAVRGWVEPSPSFSLVEQMVMQELMAEYKATSSLYDTDARRLDPTLASLQRKKPHEHALWHRFKVEGPSPRPPTNAKDILVVQNRHYVPDIGAAYARFKAAEEAVAKVRAADKELEAVKTAAKAAPGTDEAHVTALKAKIAELEKEVESVHKAADGKIEEALKIHNVNESFENLWAKLQAATAVGTPTLYLAAAQNVVIRCMLDMTEPSGESYYLLDPLVDGSSFPNYVTVLTSVVPFESTAATNAKDAKVNLEEALKSRQKDETTTFTQSSDSPILLESKAIYVYLTNENYASTWYTALQIGFLNGFEAALQGQPARTGSDGRVDLTDPTGITMSAVAYELPVAPAMMRRPVPDPEELRRFCETRVKLAANTAAAFQAAAVIFVAQSDGGSKFRDREGRAAARGALQTAVRAMLYDV